MGATLRSKTGLFTILVVLGALLGACSNQSGSSGPSHPAGQTGHADSPGQIIVRVAVNPNTIELGRRAGITVWVTNTNGRPLEGRHVQLSTTVGSLDVVDGFTDADGKFVSVLRVTQTDVANAGGVNFATVTAFVEGTSGFAIVNFASLPPVPPTLTLSPTGGITKTFGATGAAPGTCTIPAFTAQFTASGGVPPYTFSTSGAIAGATVSSSGLYSAPAIGLVSGGFTATDTVTVVDSESKSAGSTITVTCTATT